MTIDIDHVVLWVEDPMRALEFYRDIVGLEPVRLEEFMEKKASFFSMRLSERSLLDIASKAMGAMINAKVQQIGLTQNAAGTPTNHVCLAMSKEAFVALRQRVEAAKAPQFVLKDAFGARGEAPESFYFADPDGNVLEARYYGT